MAECTVQERELLDALHKARVISASEYQSNKGKLQVYRFRLFTRDERYAILKSLPDHEAGMLDEIEMVNFAVYGKLAKDIA